MQTFSFTVVLDATKITDGMEEDLYEVVNDALLSSSGEEVTLDFDREAEDEQAAIDSAIEDIRGAGYEVRLVR